jgi:hypothetical protein
MGKSQKAKPQDVTEKFSNNIAKTKGFAALIAKPRLSLIKYRAFYVVLSEIEEGHTAENSYDIHIKPMAKMLGIDHNKLMDNMRKVTKEMIGTVLEWTDSNGIFRQSGLLAGADYIEDEYVIRVSLAKNLVPHLIKMKKGYDWLYPAKVPLSFKKISSFTFYDLCCLILDEAGEHATYASKSFDEYTMREYLNMHDSYVNNISGLNRVAIQPAVEEVNKFSQLQVSCEPNKEGQRIIGWLLEVRYRPNTVPIVQPFEQTLFSEEELIPSIDDLKRTIVKGYGVSWYVFNKFLRDYGDKAPSRMWRNMNYVIRLKKKADSFPRYFYTAVTNDFELKERVAKAELEGRKKASAVVSAKLQKQMDEQIRKIDESTPALSKEEIQEFLAKFKKESRQTVRAEEEPTVYAPSTLQPEEIVALIESLPEGSRHRLDLETRYANIINQLAQSPFDSN